MGTGRDELEHLTRADLVQRAKTLGIERADFLTRPELIDEIVAASFTDEHERTIARGLLGRARDLVARVMEKGLHLPDAAQRIRVPLGNAAAPMPDAAVPDPIPTVALAQVYARQGHRTQARTVIEEVLKAEPNNAAALRLRDTLEARSGLTREPEHEHEHEHEPKKDAHGGTRRAPEMPTCDSIAVVQDLGRMHVTWQLRPTTFARNRAREPAGRLVLRLVHTLATDAGPDVLTDDRELDRLAGTADIAVPSGAISSHAALGWRDGSSFQVLVTEPRPTESAAR